MITLNLELNSESARRLYHTAMRSFFNEQHTRFEVVDDTQAEMGIRSVMAAEFSSRGVFLWLDQFVEALIFQAYYAQTQGNDSVLFWDLADEGGWVVWVDERESFIFGGEEA